jgi:hypothetical protein
VSEQHQNSRENQREGLELAKLQLEVRDLAHPLYLRPGFVSALLVVLVTVATAYFSGWWDLQRERLKSDLDDLRSQSEALRVQVDSLAWLRSQLDCRKSYALREWTWLMELLDLTLVKMSSAI